VRLESADTPLRHLRRPDLRHLRHFTRPRKGHLPGPRARLGRVAGKENRLVTSATVITSGLLGLIGMFFVFAGSANLEPDRPLYPTSAERTDLVFGMMALLCAFTAGALL
jgi:hypothetical protein